MTSAPVPAVMASTKFTVKVCDSDYWEKLEERHNAPEGENHFDSPCPRIDVEKANNQLQCKTALQAHRLVLPRKCVDPVLRNMDMFSGQYFHFESLSLGATAGESLAHYFCVDRVDILDGEDAERDGVLLEVETGSMELR